MRAALVAGLSAALTGLAPAPSRALSSAQGPLYSADPPGSYELPVIGDAPDLPLLDVVSGDELRISDWRGRVIVLSFIYTRCSDGNACPLATAVVKQTERLLLEHRLGGRVRLLSVTFDEAHDTPDVLRDYRAAAGAGAIWHFATPETAERRAALLEAYDQRLGRAADGSLTHALRVFLIDRRGRIRQIYSQSFLRADVLLGDIETLIPE